MVMLLIVPLSLMVSVTLVQLAVLRLVDSCSAKLAELEGQEILTVRPMALTLRSGDPSVWTATTAPQNPPVSVPFRNSHEKGGSSGGGRKKCP